MSDKDIDTLLEEAANLTDEDILAYRKQAGVIPEEGASTLRKVKYGWDQSSWILGDAARLAESYLSGVSSEELDKKRRQKLEREYRDLTPEDKNSFAAGTGEFLGEATDLFYTIPYFGQVGAVAKTARFADKALGSIKSGTAVGSLVAADSAIDSMARGKEISGTDIGVAAALGFTGGAIFRPTAKTARADTIDVLGQQKTLPKIIEDVVTAEDEAVIQQVLKSVDAEDSTLALALRDIPNVGKQISEANKSKKAYKKARKKLKKKYKYTDTKDPALLAKIPKELVEGNEEANRFLKNLPSLYQKYSEDLATSTFGTIERLAKDNTFNRNIFARAITRPLIGGVGGYGVGATMGMFTEDDTMSPWGWALIGMTGGLLSKKIIKSDLSLNVKEEGLRGIEDLARRSIWAQANMIFAGGSAGKLNAYGGGVAMLNKRMFKQIQGGSGSSLEETVSRVTQQLVKTVDDKTIELGIEGAQGTQLREAGWKYANGFINETELAKTFSPKQISQIQEYATFTRQFVDNYADNHVLAVGIDFRRMKEYGLPQMHNAEKILSNKDAAIRAYTQAYSKQKPSLSENEAKDAAEDFIENVLTTGNLSLREKNNFNITSSFDPRGDYVDHKLQFRPLTDHFERSREFVSLDARKEIQDFLIQDPDQILKLYLDKTVDKVEFARLFGAKGEGITNLKDQIHRETKEALKLATTEKQKTMLRSRHKNQIKAIHDTVDAFFGIFDARSTHAQNPMLNNMFGIMTTMANITYLPKAVVAATGDLIQPFQNSGVFNSLKGFSKGLSKEKDYSTTTGFASKDILGQELRQFVQTGNTVGASGGLTQTAIRKINERFFRMIGLASVTQHAGRFAYNAGIEDGFTIAQKLAKGKRSSGLLTQAKAYDLTDEAVNTLKNFKSVDEAMADPLGREFLDRIGNKASSRDRIIPEIGNRRFFTQSKDPYVRSLGQFLSWAQAKTTQLNALVTRIEDGDAALAVRMMGTLVLYDGVLTFRDFLNDPTGEKLADKDWHYESFGDKAKSFEQLVGRSAVFSGNFVPWQVDKVARIFSSGAYGDPLESISPTFSWIASMVEGAVNVGGQLAYGDTEGAAMQTIERLPLGKEALDLSAGIAGERVLYDAPNREITNKNLGVGLSPFAKGGRVSGVIRKKKDKGGIALVPNAPAEPDQRIDKMTGVPYDEQAGEAYTDVEDRQGLIAAVLGKKLQRQTFIAGGLSKLAKTIYKSTAKQTDELQDLDKLKAKHTDTNVLKQEENSPLNIIEEEYKSYAASRTPAILTERPDLEKAHWALKETKATKYINNEKIQRDISMEERRQNLADVIAGKKVWVQKSKKDLTEADEVLYEKNKDAWILKEANNPPTFNRWDYNSVKHLIENLPDPEEVKKAIGAKAKKGILGLNKRIEDGERIGGRLDIPTYKQQGNFITSLHTPKGSKATGDIKAYGSTAYLKDVTFKIDNPDSMYSVSLGVANKFPDAVIDGKWINHNPVELGKLILRDLKKPLDERTWTQVGMNPQYGGVFFDRSGKYILNDAEEAIIIGGFAVAKNPTFIPVEKVFRITKLKKNLKATKTTAKNPFTGEAIPKGTVVASEGMKIPYYSGGRTKKNV